jgi:hypothetical protein
MGIHEQCPECEFRERLSKNPIEIFLREKYGIHTFLSTDGTSIFDEKERLSFSSRFSVDCGSRITSTRAVNFNTDFFNVLRQTMHVYPTWLGSCEFKFFGKEPLPNEFNAAIIRKLGEFQDAGYDGSCDNEMWSLLLLKVEVRYKTAEELADDERRRNLPPDPDDNFPAF